MRKFRILLSGLLLILSVPGLMAQELIKNSLVTGVCYAGNKITRVYVPPPKEFYEKADTKGGAKITVYSTGFNAQAALALQYAVSILESVLPADVNITLQASWVRITTAGVLANATVTGYIGGWAIDALDPFAFYPVTVAEKIFGESLNAEQDPDIILNVNNSQNWYLGIDGKTPALQYDLVTVVLHELCHGLGFFDSMNSEGTIGYYGGNGIPVIYDTFVENFSGQRLTDTTIFLNPSTDLKREMTGGQLFFNGPLVMNYTQGSRPKLHAPELFDAGSSISHLDETIYTDAKFSLMTPYIDRSEAIHDPGKFTMSILGDLGWINTRIIHEGPSDTEEHITEVNIKAEIRSDTAYNRSKVGLVYSYDDFVNTETIYLTSPGSDNIFITSIPVSSYEQELQYYIYVEDIFGRVYRSPSLTDLFRYSIYIGTDTVKPFIAHTPADYYLSKVDSVRINALAYDNIGIDTLYVEYRVNEGPAEFIGLKSKAENRYSNAFSAKKLSLSEGDSLRYRIFARDKAQVPNVKTLPSSGYFAVKVEPIYNTVDSYSTDFSNTDEDFFNVGFEISKPANFNTPALHTLHPYKSPEESGDSINYFALLRYPVKFDGNGMIISFREVVLVEPGVAGSLFGTEDFFDYVIVEGSKDFGGSWFRLIDGYDSRYWESWETAYNSSIVGMNSTFPGSESMMMQRTFFPRTTANISAGDTMMIRFRLFSDPYANGWGWVIEDLHISPLVNRVEDVRNETFSIYPNPGDGRMNIRQDGDSWSTPLSYRIYNSAGMLIMEGRVTEGDQFSIDISPYPPGLFIIVLTCNDGVRKFRYIKF